jgi:hypothetical protein
MKLGALETNAERVPIADKCRNSSASASNLWPLPILGQSDDCRLNIIDREANVVQTLAVLLEPSCDLAWRARRYKLDVDVPGVEVRQRDWRILELVNVRHLKT